MQALPAWNFCSSAIDVEGGNDFQFMVHEMLPMAAAGIRSDNSMESGMKSVSGNSFR